MDPADDIGGQEEAHASIRGDIQDIVAWRGALGSRLDYMLRYLELDEKQVLPRTARNYVLDAVKATSTWQKQTLTVAMLKAKVEELDKLMVDLIHKQV